MENNKKNFDTDLHHCKLTQDGSFTAYSQEYNEHYHSTRDGALHESLTKHVLPASLHVKNKEEVNILDICYGLGFNTLATLMYCKNHFPHMKLNIYSPELDTALVKSLLDFSYPAEFDSLKKIIKTLSTEGTYKDENLYVELFLGDAREYIKQFENKFDIVYQDAFSPGVNPVLWTKEYFSNIKKAMKKDGILTTYSIALKTRLALHVNGFNVYINSGDDYRDATVASLSELNGFEPVNMEHKIACNSDVKPLSDEDL